MLLTLSCMVQSQLILRTQACQDSQDCAVQCPCMQLMMLGRTTAGLVPSGVIGAHHHVAVRLDDDICLAVGGREPAVLLQGLPGL